MKMTSTFEIYQNPYASHQSARIDQEIQINGVNFQPTCVHESIIDLKR